MSAIDQRIVQMQLDNTQFEKNVRTTINSLNMLKKALDFRGIESTISGVEKMMASIGGAAFTPLNIGLETAGKGFGTLKKIANGALLEMGRDVYSYGKQITNGLLKPLTSFKTAINQIQSGGWSRASNIAQAKFLLQGLEIKWDDIYDDINNAVTETRYGFDAAAQAAAKLAASGLEYGKEGFGDKNSPMYKALRGIAGLATMTDQSYERVAYVYAQIAAAGKLMGQDLMQLNSLGINVAAQISKGMGKTEKEVREMISDGELDFATFSENMYKAFGEQAGKANETYTGAYANMKAALSKIGQKFAEPYQDAFKSIYNSQRLLINQINKGLEPVYEKYNAFMENFGKGVSSLLDKWTKGLEGSVSPLTGIVDGVSSLFSSFSKLRSFDEFTEKFKEIEKSSSIIQKNGSFLDNLIGNKLQQRNTNKLIGSIKSFFGDTAQVMKKQKDFKFGDFFKDEIDGYGASLQSTSKLVANYASSILKSDKSLDGAKVDTQKLSDFIKVWPQEQKKFELPLDRVKEPLDRMKDFFNGASKSVDKFAKATKAAYDVEKIAQDVIRGDYGNQPDRFPALEEAGYYAEYIQNKVNELLDCDYRYELSQERLQEVMGETGEVAGDAYKRFERGEIILGGLGAAINIVRKAISAIGIGAAEPVVLIGNAIKEFGLNTLSNLSKGLIKLHFFLDDIGAYEKLQNAVNGVLMAFYNLGVSISGSVGKKIEHIKGLLAPAIEKIEHIKGLLAPAIEWTKQFYASFKETDAFKQMKADLDWFVDTVKTTWSNFTDWLVDTVKTTWSNFTDWLGSRFDFIDNLKLPKIFTTDPSKYAGLASGMWLKMRENVEDALSPLLNLFGGKGKNNPLKTEFFKQVGEKAVLDLKDGIKKPIDYLKDGDIAGSFKFFYGKVSKEAETEGEGLFKTIASSIRNSLAQYVNFENIKSIKLSDIPKALFTTLAGVEVQAATMEGDVESTASTTVSFLDKVANEAQIYAGKIVDAFNQTTGPIEFVKNTISNFLKWINPEFDGSFKELKDTIMKVAFTIGDIKVALGLTDIVAGAGKAVKGVGKWTKSINDIIKKSQDIPEAIKKVPEAISNFFGGTGIGSIFDKFFNGTTGLNGFLSEVNERFKGVEKTIKKVGKSIARKNTADALLRVAGAVGVFALSMKLLGSLSWDQFKVAAASIVVISGALALLLYVLSKFTMKNADSESGGDAVTKLSERVLKPLTKRLDDFKKDATKLLKGKAIAVLAVALGTVIAKLVKGLMNLAGLDTGALIRGVVGLGVVMGEFALLVKSITKSAAAHKSTLRDTFVILAIGHALYRVAQAVTLLGKMTFGDAVVGLGSLVVVTAMFTKILDAAGGKGGWGKMLALAIIIGEVAIAMAALTILPKDRLKNVANSLMKVFGSLALFVYALSIDKSKFLRSLGTVGLLALLIAEISAIFMSLSITGNTNGIKSIGEGFAALIASLSAIILSLAIANKLGGVGGFWDNIETFGVVIAVTGLIGIISFLVGAIDEANNGVIKKFTKNSVKIMENLGKTIGGFIGNIAGGIIKPIKSAIFGDETVSSKLESFGTFIKDLAAIFSGDVSYNESAIDAIGNLLLKIVEADLLNSVSNVINNLLTIGFEHNETLADKIGSFKTCITELANLFGSNSFPQVDENAMTAFSTIVTAFANADLANTLSNAVGKINLILTGPFGNASFGTKLRRFAKAMVDYSNIIGGSGETAGMNKSAVTSTQDAVLAVIELAKLTPKSGGVKQLLFGSKGFGFTFEGLPTFATKMKEYGDNIDGMNTSAVEETKAAVKSILYLSKKTVKTGGILQDIMGTNNWYTTGSGLSDFATQAKAYGDNISGMNTSAVEETKAAVGSILELANAVPNTGGLLAMIVGDNKVNDFGGQLVAFGSQVKTFASEINGIDYAGVDPLVTGLTSLSSVFQAMYDIIPADDLFGLQNRMLSLSSYVTAMYTELANGLNADDGETLKSAGGSIFKILLDAFETEAEKPESLSRLVGAIETFMTDNSVGAGIEKKAGSLIGEVLEGIQTTLDLSKLKFYGAFAKILDKMFDTSDIVISERGTKMNSTMNTSFVKLAASIRGHRSDVNGAVRTALGGIASIFTEYINKFRLSGVQMMTGLAGGIRDGKSFAIIAAGQAATDILSQANSTLKIKSPSREFWNTGLFSMKGLAYGIKDNETYVLQTVSDVAGKAISVMDGEIGDMRGVSEETMKQVYATIVGAWQYIATAVNDGLTFSPVITPVVDLSNVKAGLGNVNGMLTDTSAFNRLSIPGLDITGGIQAKTGDLYSQEAIVSAIRGVRSDITQLGDSISKLQIMMNTGQVVGAVTPGVDRELGNIQKYSMRWA